MTEKKETPPPAKTTTAQPSSTPPKAEPQALSSESLSQYDLSDGSGYQNQPTQQIPTYQDNDSSEYREPPPRPDQSYAGALNRPVRPSEMKEEG